jgi:hypothetical protein
MIVSALIRPLVAHAPAPSGLSMVGYMAGGLQGPSAQAQTVARLAAELRAMAANSECKYS